MTTDDREPDSTTPNTNPPAASTPGEPETTRRRLRTFPTLDPQQLMHPWDVKATAALGKVPGLQLATRKMMEYGLERLYYLENTADNVRVTDTMFPRLHRYLQWGCKILGVDEPEMYVNMDPVPNAYTYGHTRPFIVLTSGLVDLLDEQERLFVIGHELGHIKFGHVLYTVLAENIRVVIDIIGRATLGVGSLLGTGLALPLLDWYRKAELSADRAAVLCTQDEDVAIRTFMKLAGGSRELFAEMDADEFMRQIRDYEEADESSLNKFYKLWLTAFRTHPFPIMRANHLDQWIRSGECQKITGLEL